MRRAAVSLPLRARRLRLAAFLAATVSCASGAFAQAIFLTAPSAVAQLSSSASPQRAPAAEAAPATWPAPLPAGSFAVRPPAPSAPLAGAFPLPGDTAVASSRPATAEGKARATVLRHLANNIQGYRLAGEIGSSEWPMYLTEKQARGHVRFQLGYLSAVSVMPELSRLLLTINDQPVGATPVDAVQSVKTVVFDIPPGLLQPGFNSVRLTARQRHRVDCSLAATQELWTQIDPTQTGLILAEADATIDAIADLAALPADEQGALPIRAVAPVQANARDVARLMRVVQVISIVGRFEQPVVDSGPMAGGRYGVNLLVGTAAELAAIVDPKLIGAVERPRAFILPATPERRTTIVVTGADARQVEAAIRQLLVATTPKGAAAGIRAAAAFPGYRLEGGQSVKLADLGVKSAEFDGRLFRAAFNIVMPSDFYPADYGRATLRVAGGYAPGLASGAQLVMYVNERTAVSLPLLRSNGEVFTDNPLPLPLGFLRPGLNRVEIEAHLPAPADESCNTLAPRTSNRFLFLDSTTLEIPPIARVGRMPDLAVTATGGFPFAGGARRSKLYLPRLDQKSVGAAATFVAHLAVGAGRPIDFEIAETPPLHNNGPTLAVAPYDSFDPEILRRLGMPVEDLSRIWGDKIGGASASGGASVLDDARRRLALQNNFPIACGPPDARRYAFHGALDPVVTGSLDGGDELAARDGGDEEPGADLFQEWDARLREESRVTALVDWLGRVGEWSRAKFTDAAAWMRRFERARAELSPRTSLALGQNILGETSDNVWTVLTAPNADALADSVACLVDPRVSRQIAGRLSLLDVSRAQIDATPVADARFVVTQPLSLGNARLIAAGWLSLHALYYVAAVLALGFLLAGATRVFVKNVGRRTS
jgi:hypothetical protein